MTTMPRTPAAAPGLIARIADPFFPLAGTDGDRTEQLEGVGDRVDPSDPTVFDREAHGDSSAGHIDANACHFVEPDIVREEVGQLCCVNQERRDLPITTGLVDTSSTPALLRLVAAHQVDAARFVTHRFALKGIEEAYDVSGRAAETGAIERVLIR